MNKSNNPLISKLRLPGETFQLPSQGLFYNNGELDESVMNGEVEVYAMTTIDEIIFNTPDKLLSGKAVIEVFSRCIPQILKPLDLLTKDIDFLLICLRLVTFGQFMEVGHKHTCENTIERIYSVDLQKLIRSVRKIDPTTISKEYNVVLPNGQNITIQPMKYGRMVHIYDMTATQKTDNELTTEEAENMIVTMISSVIGSVDGITDPILIDEWVRALNLGWKKLLEKTISGVTDWGIDFVVKQQCQDCGDEISLPITANPVSFFFQQ
jgi:hypothetical protein